MHGIDEGHLSMGQLKGRSVIDSRGTAIGEVEDVTIDPAGWRVAGIRVNVRKEVADSLRLDRPMFGSAHLQVATERIESVGDAILLNVDTAEMASRLYQGP